MTLAAEASVRVEAGCVQATVGELTLVHVSLTQATCRVTARQAQLTHVVASRI